MISMSRGMFVVTRCEREREEGEEDGEVGT